MRPERLKALLEEVRSGSLTVAKASEELTSVLRQAPFEDLGFAKVDHHRAIRQGFPEVVFGNGKTAEQIATIASAIVKAGHDLLVTRTDANAYAVVRTHVPARFFTRPRGSSATHQAGLQQERVISSSSRGERLINPWLKRRWSQPKSWVTRSTISMTSA